MLKPFPTIIQVKRSIHSIFTRNYFNLMYIFVFAILPKSQVKRSEYM